jgi:hypothetical protein
VTLTGQNLVLYVDAVYLLEDLNGTQGT